jgi:hypothetical protein
VTPERADGNVGADIPTPAIHASAITWAVPWIWLLILLVVAGVVLGVVWWRRRSNAQLADALREYALQSQADARSGELVDQGVHGGDSESAR